MSRRLRFRRDRTKAVSRKKIILFALFALVEMAMIVLMMLLTKNIASTRVVAYSNFVLRLLAISLSFHIIFARHDKSEYRFLWLLLIIIEPIMGSIFYLIFAERKPKERVKSLFSYTRPTSQISQESLEVVDYSLRPLAKFLHNVQGQDVFNNCKFELFMPCDDVYKRLIEDIRAAEHYIILQTFILSSGKFLTSILDEIEKKDIKAYFYTDDFGSFASIKINDAARMRKMGIKLIRYNKIHVLFHPYSNYRNHRKLIVIDGKVGYIGGMNIADEYLNWTNRFGKWVDSIARIEGECVKSFVKSFERDWKMSSSEPLELVSNVDNSIDKKGDAYFSTPIQFYTSSPSIDSSSMAEEVLVTLLMSAKKNIRIITPYLSLTDSIYNALYFAKNSGVDISVIIPGIADKKFVYLQTLNTADKLSKNSIDVNIYKDGFAHAKLIIIDDKCINLSSVNFDYRSFYLSLESGINVYDGKKCLECIDMFDKLLGQCVPYSPKPRTIRTRILNWFAIMLRSYF